MSDNNEWVPLTAEQAEHVEKGTVVRVEADGMTVTGPLHRIVSHENDDDVVAYVGSREGSKWLVRGAVSVSPKDAARVVDRADPDRVIVKVLDAVASKPGATALAHLREAGFGAP